MFRSGGKRFLYAIAVLLAVAVLLFYFMQIRRGAEKGFQLGTVGEVVDPEMELFLSFEKKDFPWSQRISSDGLLPNFDLFTGPSVFMENGKALIKTYEMLLIDDVFPLYLSEIKAKPYRLKVEGYSRSKSDNTIVVMFHDIETDEYGECAVDDRSETLKMHVKEVEIQQQEKNGSVYETPMIRIYDESARREFVLTNEQKFLEGEYIVIVKDIAANEYIFYDTGDSVKIGEAECILRSFSEKDGSARLLLKDAQGQEFNKMVHLIR
ncbi:MAG: hypothetical protein LBI56_02205 [Puniceicoccales bacterium]|nr:hypothetical protein [Puniceicoccales bacterium]